MSRARQILLDIYNQDIRASGITLNLTANERLALARRRILSVLKAQRVCSGRTLENKIADAGPTNMRIDPHVITNALRQAGRDGQVRVMRRQTAHWYTLPSLPEPEINSRLAELEPIQRAFAQGGFVTRVGQALEIAIYRSLASNNALDLLGGFLDLAKHGDDVLYRREEPPSLWRGNSYLRGKLDFIVIGRHTAIAGGVEVKNLREWIYPDRQEVKDLLKKCCALDLVPILIGRRIHYTTTRLLVPRGGIVRETYNQRIPETDVWLAQRAKSKQLLGYHDIRLGNQPDARMLGFAEQLPSLLPTARRKFETGGRAELDAFAHGQASLAALGLGL